MKTYFNDQQIFPYKPNPKKNQVWESETGNKYIVLSITKDVNKNVVSVLMQSEDKSKSIIGCAWLNGYEYKYIGYIF